MKSENILINLCKIWEHRELLFFLTQRELKVRYKQAFFGVAWAIITPLSQAVIFAVIFGILLRVSEGTIPYILLVFTGMTFWNFFSQSVTMSTFALTGNYNLVIKSTFPKEILVLSTILSRVPDLLLSFILLVGMIFYYHLNISAVAFWLIPLFILELLLTIGVGLLFSATNVYYRDVTAIVPPLLVLWLYLTPVVYPFTLIPEQYRIYLLMNPLTGIIYSIHSALLFRQVPDFQLLIWPSLATLMLLIISYVVFKKLEKGFADTI